MASASFVTTPKQRKAIIVIVAVENMDIHFNRSKACFLIFAVKFGV